MNHDEVMGSTLMRAGAFLSRSPGRPVRIREAASVLFLVDGMTFGTWAALIPSFQQKLGLSTGQLSGVLVGLVVGAMGSMPLAGRLVARHGSHRVGSAAGIAFPGALLALLLAPNLGWLVAAGALFGACKGFLDVAVSAQGIAVENALGKPVVSSFNGFWSSGGLLAAALTSFALHLGVPTSQFVGLMAVLLAVTVLAVGRSLLADDPAVPPREAAAGFSLPDRRLLWLGALAFLALFSEGVLLDWSAAYAHVVAHVSLATAPVAFAAFSISMAAGRFSGDWLTARRGTGVVLGGSALLLVLGTALAALVHVWPVILVGFMLIGLGIANLVPTIFRAAGRVHAGGAGPGVAMVSTLGYTGFLCGPPTVGFVAVLAGLPTAFCLLIAAGLILAATGKTVLAAASPNHQTASR